MPSPVNPPSGCRFHTRCWLYERLGQPETCRTDDPPLKVLEGDQSAACHFAEEALKTDVGIAHLARRAGRGAARRPRRSRRSRGRRRPEPALEAPALDPGVLGSPGSVEETPATEMPEGFGYTTILTESPEKREDEAR